MLRTSQNGHYDESQSLGEYQFAETPFADPRKFEQEDAVHESGVGGSYAGQWEFTSPFLPCESSEAGESGEAVVMTPEAGAFSEITAELKDTLFREALEQLADEALDAHPSLHSGEYGDRETRDLAAERVLHEHFQPLASQAEALLDRFFERLEGYEAESLTDSELERISDEVMPVNIGNPREMTILEFATTIIELTGSKSSLIRQPLPEDDPKQRRPDIAKARRVLKWEPKVTLEEGLRPTIEYFQTILSK